MNRRDFLRAGAIAAGAAATAIPSSLGATEVSGPSTPSLPFVIELASHPGAYAFCYPCDRISHGNFYLLRDRRLIWGEKFGGTHIDLFDGQGARRVPDHSLDQEIIGWLVEVHHHNKLGWRPWSDFSPTWTEIPSW